jgi:hypothetical protein
VPAVGARARIRARAALVIGAAAFVVTPDVLSAVLALSLLLLLLWVGGDGGRDGHPSRCCAARDGVSATRVEGPSPARARNREARELNRGARI